MQLWKCLHCKQIFTDEEHEKEEDDRCPVCKMPFAQMPFEAAHFIADYEPYKPF